VVLTASVKVLGLPGLGITPTGLVSFSATNGSSTTALGSKALGSCFLKTCTASITTTAIPVGSTSVKATYAGDLLAAASSGSAAVSVAPLPDPDPEPDAEDEVTCGSATTTCTTDTVVSPDGSTELTVSSTGGGAQTVSASLTEGVALECPGQDDIDTGGALATFNNTSGSAGKTIVYRLYGAAAVAMNENYSNHTTFLGCYASPDPFFGYTSGAFGPAQFDSEAGQYRAQLNSCANNGGSKPCFVFHNALALDPPYVEVTIQTPPGDPNFR